MQPEPLLQWSDPVLQFVGFVGQFLAAGAIGFRYFALRGRLIETDRPFYEGAERRAAVLGTIGVVIGVVLAAFQLPGLAARKHMAAGAFLTSERRDGGSRRSASSSARCAWRCSASGRR